MSFLIDIIILAILVITVFISAKRGFVRTAIELLGFILAFIISTNLGAALADLTYDKAIEPPIINVVVENGTEEVGSAVDKVWESLPDIISDNAEFFGVSKDYLTQKLNDGTQITETVLTDISQNSIKPIVSRFLSTLYTLIIFVILLVIVGFLSKFINKLFSFSIIGKLNRFLGGLIGIPKGIVYVLIFCLVLNLVLYFFPNGLWIFNRENTEKSYLYNLLVSMIPFN